MDSRQYYSFSLFCLLCMMPVCLSAQGKKISYQDLRRPAGATMYHTPVGLCEDYPEETTNLTVIRNDMEAMKKADVHLLRIAFGWDGIMAEKDKYDWLFWDDYVKMAVDE